MRMPYTCLFRGEQMTISEIAAVAGVTSSVMRCRILVCGMTPEEAVAHKFGTNRRSGFVGKKYDFHGQLLSVREISEVTGQSRTWVMSRLVDGRFVDRDRSAYADPERHPLWPTYTHNGVTDTVSGWAKRTGINKATLNNRLGKGWTIGRALTQPVVIGRPVSTQARRKGPRA